MNSALRFSVEFYVIIIGESQVSSFMESSHMELLSLMESSHMESSHMESSHMESSHMEPSLMDSPRELNSVLLQNLAS